MKVTITHLKAPWPEGAKVGDVVSIGDAIPGWALGKCVPAPEDATPTAGDHKPAKAEKPAKSEKDAAK